MYHNIIYKAPATGAMWIFKNQSCSLRIGSEFVLLIEKKYLAKATVKGQMKSMPSQLFFIPFHRVLPRLDAWFLNPWGEQEKIKIKTRKWWCLKWEFIFLQTGATFSNKSHCNISCAFSLITISLCFSKRLLKKLPLSQTLKKTRQYLHCRLGWK